MTSLLIALLVGPAAAAPDTTALPRYEIAARILPADGVVEARVAISVPWEARGEADSLVLRIPARYEGETARPRFVLARLTDARDRSLSHRLSPDSLSVSIPAAAVGRNDTLVAEYRIPFDSSSAAQLGYFLFTGVGPDGAWYPVAQGLAGVAGRLADFEVSVSAPRELAVLTSGAPRGRGSKQYHARGIEGFALAFGAGHRLVSVDREGIRVTALAPSADTARFRGVAEEALAAADWYRRAYGFFPLGHFGIVPGVAGAAGGWPLPNAFMVHRADLTAPFIRFITAHELGHYYWGLRVLDPDERLGWLVLANGIWADQYQLAQREGTDVTHQWRRSPGRWLEWFATSQVGNYEQRLGLGEAEQGALGFDYNTLVKHGKAATGLYLASRRVGWENFLVLQRGLLRDFRDRPLPVDSFVARVEEAGFPGARRFFDAWVRGDARLDYQVRRVRPDGGGTWWVVLERTGTVPYPVEVAVRAAEGRDERLAFAGDAELDSLPVRLAGPPVEVRVDPDGVLPMRTSGHPEMRRLFLLGLANAGLGDWFLDAALDHLATQPDAELRAVVVTRLFDLGRYRRAVEAGTAAADPLACRSRSTCRAAILTARALARIGEAPRARSLLASVQPRVAEHGAIAQWEEAEREVGREQ